MTNEKTLNVEACDSEDKILLHDFRATIVAGSLEEAKEKFIRSNPDVKLFEFEDRTLGYKSKKFDDIMEAEMEQLTEPRGFVVVLQKAIPNENKIKTTSSNFKQDGVRDWTSTFRVCYMNADRVIAPIPDGIPYDNKKDCVKAGRAWTSETKVRSYIKVTKELLSPKDTIFVTEIEYKPSRRERQGTYLFFGRE
jgi:hypothetical protein